MFPVTSKRFASSIHVPRRIIFGGLPYESTPVNVARLPDMEAIERRSTGPAMQIPSMPDSYTVSSSSSSTTSTVPQIAVIAEVSPGSVSSTGSPATH